MSSMLDLEVSMQEKNNRFQRESILCTFRTGGYRRRYICRVGSPLDNDMYIHGSVRMCVCMRKCPAFLCC